MQYVNGIASYHAAADTNLIYAGGADAKFRPRSYTVQQYSYHFENFFHPFVGKLIAQLNQSSVAGMLDPGFLVNCTYNYVNAGEYQLNNGAGGNPIVLDSHLDPDGFQFVNRKFR